MLYRYIISYAIQIYQVSISTATISTITDKIISKVKDGGKYVSKAVYTILGVGMDGKKDILGLYLSESGWIKRVS